MGSRVLPHSQCSLTIPILVATGPVIAEFLTSSVSLTESICGKARAWTVLLHAHLFYVAHKAVTSPDSFWTQSQESPQHLCSSGMTRVETCHSLYFLLSVFGVVLSWTSLCQEFLAFFGQLAGGGEGTEHFPQSLGESLEE